SRVRKLEDQVVGRRRAMGLVLLEFGVPEGRRLGVEGHTEVGRPLVDDEFAQDGGERQDGVGGETLGVGETRRRVVVAKDVVRAIHEEKVAVLLRHRSSGASLAGRRRSHLLTGPRPPVYSLSMEQLGLMRPGPRSARRLAIVVFVLLVGIP